MTQRVSAAEQGELQGANSSLMGLVGLAGPGIFTFSFAQALAVVARPAAGAVWVTGLPFLLAAALTAVSFLIALKVARPLPRH